MVDRVVMLCPPGADGPNCVQPQPFNFSETIIDSLSYIGLREDSKVDTNTPLEIIRHFADGQSYGDAFVWAWSFGLLVWVLVFIYGLSRAFSEDFLPSWHDVMVVLRKCIYIISFVYIVSTSSVLLNDTQPLTVAEFVKFVLWLVSIVVLAFSTFVYVEVCWTVGRPIYNFLYDRSSVLCAIFGAAGICGALYLWGVIH